MEPFGIRCEISRCHSWQRSHIIFPNSLACQCEWISISDCILPMYSLSEVWIWDGTSAFPAPSCLQVPLCIKAPYVFGQARRAVNFITLPCFTERRGYRWWILLALIKDKTWPQTSSSGLLVWGTCRMGLASLSQVNLFQTDLSYLSPLIVFKYQQY